jgi:DNA-binding response OmpR family regulator
MLRILVVDDERDVADAIKAGLTMSGFEVDLFYDPIAALAAFRPDVYDLVISDIKMPKMNGFEMVYEIKKVDKDVQVIFLTGYVDLMKEVNKLFTKLNIREVIQKPIGVKELAQRIRAMNLDMRATPNVEETERAPHHEAQ